MDDAQEILRHPELLSSRPVTVGSLRVRLMSMKKQIHLDQLIPGMYLLGVDQSWWKTPFLVHHRLIKEQREIESLRQSSVKMVVIDTSKGLDVQECMEGDSDRSQCHQGESSLIFEGLTEDCQEREQLPHGPFSVSTSDAIPQAPINHSLELESSDAIADSQLVRAQQFRETVAQAVGKVFEGVVAGRPIDNPMLEDTARRIIGHLIENSHALPQIVLVQNLKLIEKHLYHHVVDVCVLSVVLGIELGWKEQDLYHLALGALLHDIGYLRLPRNVVRKRENPSDVERLLLLQHIDIGQAIVHSCPGIPEPVSRIVQEHHERIDGSGAPHGLTHSAICPLSQIVAVMDHFDNSSSNWGVGPARSAALVLRELYDEARRGTFDVKPIERFIRCLGVYPPGSLVELSTGERGIVAVTNPEESLKPLVKLISDSDGQVYPVPLLIDLASPKLGQPERVIRSLLDPVAEQIPVGKYLAAVGA